MKFNLSTTRVYYSKEEKSKLENFGFNFERVENTKETDKNAYCTSAPVSYEINTLEELMALIKEYCTIVLSENEIEFYDDWRE